MARTRKVLRSEVLRRERAIEELWLQGVPTRQIAALAREQLGMGPNAVQTTLDRIKQRCSEEYEEQRPFWKLQAIQRLSKSIRAAREAKDWTSVGTLERLLADIQGTREPVRLDVNVHMTQALVAVVGSLSTERMNELVQQYDDLKSKAELVDTTATTLQALPQSALRRTH